MALPRETISRYLIRAPFSVEQITWAPGRSSVIYRTKMVKGPNRNFQVYDPLDFLANLTAHIPDKGEHLVRWMRVCAHRGGCRGKGASPCGVTARGRDEEERSGVPEGR